MFEELSWLTACAQRANCICRNNDSLVVAIIFIGRIDLRDISCRNKGKSLLIREW